MCGIVGYIQQGNVDAHWDDKYRGALSDLIFMDTLRGYDSTGILVVPKHKPKDTFILKKAIPGPMFLELEAYKRVLEAQRQPGIYLAHNRAATRGAVSDDNAHPFKVGHIHLVHNGSVNHHVLRTGIDHKVDSAHIAHAIYTLGAASALPQVDGPAVLVWWDSKENSMNVARTKDRNIYWIFDEKGTCWFASEREMIWAAAVRNHIGLIGEFYNPPEYHHFKWMLGQSDNKLGQIIKNKFDEYKYVPPPHNPLWDRKEQVVLGEALQRDLAKKKEQHGGTGYCPAGTPTTENPIKRHEVFGKRKIKKVGGELERYGLVLGQEIEVTQVKWQADKVDKLMGDIECLWPAKGMKVLLPDVPVSLFHRNASGKHTVQVYNVIKTLVPKEGRHEPVLYAKSIPYSMSDLVQGPKGKLIPKDEFIRLAQPGCGYCGREVQVDAHETISWLQGDRPLCRICSVTKERVENLP